MIITVQSCDKCGSEQLRRNGSSNGRSKYQCTACGHQGYLDQKAVERTQRYAQVEALLTERVSQRGIARATGVARGTIRRLAKKKPIS
jgi:transposase-like protein